MPRCASHLVLLLCLLPTLAVAAPPPVGSDDWNIMAPYKAWVTAQHDGLGRWCCDIGDGRPVDAFVCANAPAQLPGWPIGTIGCVKHESDKEDLWWAHVTRKHFPDTNQLCGAVAGPGSETCLQVGPNGLWLAVPDEKITRNANPTGVPILWLYEGRVQCFAPPDGV